MIDPVTLGFALFVRNEVGAGRSAEHTGIYGREGFEWRGATPLPSEDDLRALGEKEIIRRQRRDRFIERLGGMHEAVHVIALAINGQQAAKKKIAEALAAAEN